jgi:hypothetical protein
MGDVEDTPGFIAYWIFMSFMLSLFVVAVIGHCVMGKIEAPTKKNRKKCN